MNCKNCRYHETKTIYECKFGDSAMCLYRFSIMKYVIGLFK